ncbi:hypothetical protein MKX01_008545 [Papaver californicum]|nr:hypothetical protein MKX01_008545 [Papaver californicum]
MFNEEELKRCCCEKQESMEQQQDPVKYGDVFPVSGELASEPQLLAQLLINAFVHPGSAQGMKGQVAYGGDGGDGGVGGGNDIDIGEAENITIGRNVITPGGVAAVSQAAATFNARISREEDKTTLGDVLTVAFVKLPADKKVTYRDAEGVVGADMRNNNNISSATTISIN